MRARIPAGIDLEDRLLYGLTPARLGYVAGLAVLAIWLWRQPVWLPLRLVAALLLVAAGCAVGWLRRDGRHLDAWAEDLARYVLRNYRIVLRRVRRPRRRARERVPPARVTVPVQAEPSAVVSLVILGSNEPP
jgi:hypothetical protein